MAAPEMVIQKIQKARNLEDLQAPPEFPEHATYFHPIPVQLRKRVKEGEVWEGYFGKNYHNGKTDRRGKKIYLRYFIPVKKIS